MIDEENFGQETRPYVMFGLFDLAIYLTLITTVIKGAHHFILIERQETCAVQNQALVNRIASAIFQDEESTQGPGWAIL